MYACVYACACVRANLSLLPLLWRLGGSFATFLESLQLANVVVLVVVVIIVLIVIASPRRSEYARAHACGVCVRVCACVCARLCACVCVRLCACVCVRVYNSLALV